MKKILLMGKSGCGKTTLTQRINGENLEYKKTQMITHSNDILDTPGEYLENRSMYNALIISSYDSDVIGMVLAKDDGDSMFPPGFSSAFTKPVIGIVTKADKEGDEKRAVESLKNAGATEIFILSSYENKGIEELIKYLKNDTN